MEHHVTRELPDDPLTLDATLAGRYRIAALIGSGATGFVYKAQDTQLGHVVAIKVLRPEFVLQTDFSKLKQETEILRRSACPNLAQTFDCGQSENLIYIVTEYVEGSTLEQMLREGQPTPLPFALDIVCQAGRGLECVHQNGLIHRDIKPANIFASSDRRVLLTDVGLATHWAIVGTPAYMSPEQVLGRAIDQRADIFSLGIVMYQLVTGWIPFTGASLGDLFRNIAIVDPILPHVRNPLLSPDLGQVLMKMLAKDPDQRFSTMGVVLEALEPFRSESASWASS